MGLKLCKWTCLGIALVIFLLPASTLAIEYPTGPVEPKPMATPPDLAVTRVWLTKECKVRITVTNPGPANLAPVYYQKNTPKLYLYRNGKPWGGVTLAVLDPQKILVKKGGQVVFTSNLKVNGTEKIRAVLDNRNVLNEQEERNNARNVELTCNAALPALASPKPATVLTVPMGKPDLLVQSVTLTKDCRVMVTLLNKGPGQLPDSAWEKKTSPTLMLYRNGKSWGGANLTVIDPRQRLKDVNGRVRYGFNLKVGGQTNIQAVIDYHGILAEVDKRNNAKEIALQCN